MSGLFDWESLSGKISTAYMLLVSASVLFGLLAFSDLIYVDRRLNEGLRVIEFKDTVLEMRREEKSLFLYMDTDSLENTRQYAVRSASMLAEFDAVYEPLIGQQAFQQLQQQLELYLGYLRDWPASDAEQIGEVGHLIYLGSEALARNERQQLSRSVKKSQWFLVITIALIALSILLVGRQLKRMVVTPIKKLEKRLKPIAEGRFKQLSAPSNDREFETFTRAFNLMLKELELRQRRMQHSEKLASLGILASGVAHELNNPLSNISTTSQILMEEWQDTDPHQVHRWLQQIDSETQRGRAIVRSLLDFGARRVFEKQPCEILKVIEQTQTMLAKTLAEQNCVIRVNVSEQLVASIDKYRFQQLIINLVQNATNAARGGLNITISAVYSDRSALTVPPEAEVAGDLDCLLSDDRFVELMISDDGPGIDKAMLPRVFDPFFTTSQPGHGIGLGLYIVQEIVRDHQGCLAITSRPGQGTRVIILLPVGDVND